MEDNINTVNETDQFPQDDSEPGLFGRYDPAGLKLSGKKYRIIRKIICTEFREWFGYTFGMRRILSHALKRGDTMPAIVVSTEPFIISLYSEDFDAVMLFRYPIALAERYSISPGDRLTVSCCYVWRTSHNELSEYIIPGPKAGNMFVDIAPYVQLFWAKDEKKIRTMLYHFSAEEWKYVEELTSRFTSEHPGLVRDGFWSVRHDMMRWFSII